MQMTGTNKYNVDLDSLAFFYEPKLGWIVQEVSNAINIIVILRSMLYSRVRHAICSYITVFYRIVLIWIVMVLSMP